MPKADIRDLNIRGVNHPKYTLNKPIEDRTIEIIVQKLEVVLFTNKGDVMSNPDFGANLEYYLWSTNVPIGKIEYEIKVQIDAYVPELNQMGYELSTELFEGTARDILYINIRIKDTQVNFVVN